MPNFDDLRRKLSNGKLVDPDMQGAMSDNDANAANSIVANPYTQKKQPVSSLESGLRGAAQGISMGYADELAGALGAGKEALTGEAPLNDLAGAYRRNRDESRQAYQDAEQANPKTYKAGEVAGMVGSLAVPGMGALKGAKAAAALGALGGLGHSQADLTQGQVLPALEDTAVGGALGFAGGKALEKVAPRFQGLMQKIGSKPAAEAEQVAAQVGGPQPIQSEEAFRKAMNPDLYEAQTTGKISPNLKAQSQQLSNDIAQMDTEYAAKIAQEAKANGFNDVDAYLRHLKQQQLERIRMSGSSSGKLDIPANMIDTPTTTIP